MKTISILLLGVVLTSGAFAEIKPFGSLGRGRLEHAEFLPDGRVITVLSNRIELRDANTGDAVASFAQRSDIGRVAISPNGLWVAIVSRDGKVDTSQIEIWEIHTQRRLGQWDTSVQISSSSSVRVAAFSPIAPVLAVATVSDIHLYNWETQAYLGKMEGARAPGASPSGPINLSLAFSPDGKHLAVGSIRLVAEIWDVSTRRLVGHLAGHEDGVLRVAYSPDGRWLATASSLIAYLWDAQTRTRVQRLATRGRGRITHLFFSQDSGEVYVVSKGWFGGPGRDDKVRIFDVQTGEGLGAFGDEAIIHLEHASLSPDEQTALLKYSRNPGVIVLWDIQRNRRIHLWGDYWTSYFREISPDGRSLVTTESTVLKIWDIPSQSLRQAIFAHEGEIHWAAISPDSQKVVVGHGPRHELRDIYTGEVITQIPIASGLYRPLTFSSDSTRIATFTGSAIVIDINRPNEPQRLELNPPWPFAPDSTSLTFSRDDAYLASADSDGGIHLWQRNGNGGYTYRYSWQCGIRDSRVSFPAPSAGVTFATLLVSNYHQTQLWCLKPSAPQQITPLELKDMGEAQFSRVGPYLFANRDDQLQVWDSKAGMPIALPPIPRYLAVNADGSVLLTEGEQVGQMLLWNLSPLLDPSVVAVQPQQKQAMILGAIKHNALYQNFPNPFNPETWIPYDLAADANVNIAIYNAIGRRIRIIELGAQRAGSYVLKNKAAYWNGRSDTGELVSSDIYFYYLRAGDFAATKKMIVLK